MGAPRQSYAIPPYGISQAAVVSDIIRDTPAPDDIRGAVAAAFASGKAHLVEIEIEGKR